MQEVARLSYNNVDRSDNPCVSIPDNNWEGDIARFLRPKGREGHTPGARFSVPGRGTCVGAPVEQNR